MTNHGETTGSFGNDDITGQEGRKGQSAPDTRSISEPAPKPTAAAGAEVLDGRTGTHQVTLRTPAELADALPYLLGYRPEDSIVLVALHDWGGRGRFGGRARLGIPANPDDWASVAAELTRGLMTGSARRRGTPEGVVAYLCQDPGDGETARQVMERLRPLADELRHRCSRAGAPVVEAICISGGRFWSYCCERRGCCPADGEPMGLPGTSVLAAAATYAGIQVRGTLRELRARLLPWETAAALEQEVALDTAGMALVPRILDGSGRVDVAEETLALAQRLIGRLATARPVTGTLQADLRDDELIDHEEAATLILGLQDRTTRDRAAEWMEGDEAGPALRLWRALARRCVGPYTEHAAAPLTLAGWVAWSTGDELEAREALAMALGADPGYLFARLLHQAINEGLDPESIRRCLRGEPEGRTTRAPGTGHDPVAADGTASGVAETTGKAGVREGADAGERPSAAVPDDPQEPGDAAPTAPAAPIAPTGLTAPDDPAVLVEPDRAGAGGHPGLVPAPGASALRRARARALPSGAKAPNTTGAGPRSRKRAAGTHPGAGRLGGTRPRSPKGSARRGSRTEEPRSGSGTGGGAQEDR
ncbi:DUF4192 domain-containing protein [Streptomyces glaucescens]|uniref:DUF4192 domain-containing protein n=1 Tax=Streptomyces glaucescens TaxID=1907 RepID=A0A089XCJ5_STRGA|nr:DUF4192 domain-containing protein [Streptomyces glaucescens]AIS00954.1 hypothetical protein SGLAU_25080 [Streptomyces glaucescens]